MDEAGQKVCSGHVTGVVVFSAQYLPSGHGSIAESGVEQNLPAMQTLGAMDLAGQKVPLGHVAISTGEAQKEPAGQSTGAELPSAQYVPSGHDCGETERAGQNEPMGHVAITAGETQ